jgi:hypothetical protein
MRERVLANDEDMNLNLARDMAWIFDGMSVEEVLLLKYAAQRQYENLRPQDAIEQGLAIAMVASLHLGLGCASASRRASHAPGAVGAYATYGLKAFRVYADLAHNLDRRRGRADQKVVVRHVTVQSGGQAIVGDVTPSTHQLASPPTPSDLSPRALQHMPQPLAAVATAPRIKSDSGVGPVAEVAGRNGSAPPRARRRKAIANEER